MKGTSQSRNTSPPASDRITPDAWAERISAPADYSSDRRIWPSALVRHWSGTSADMPQPPLDHHYIAQHLGGAKRVERWHEGPAVSTTVEAGALTIVPAGTQFTWRTRGPIEFAHLYISPGYLEDTALRLDRAKEWSLVDAVGTRDPLLEALFSQMLREIRRPGEMSVLHLDCLLEAFAIQLLRDHSTARVRAARSREMLTGFRLARVIEFVNARLEENLDLADLAGVAGGSVYHFSRAFKNSTGETPYQFVIRRRVERAKTLLTTTQLTIAEVAAACGFHSSLQLARAFRRVVRVTPLRFRRTAI